MKKNPIRALFRTLPRGVRRFAHHPVVPPQLVEWGLRFGSADKQAPQAPRDVRLLETKLWGGFSQYALRDLDILKARPGSSPVHAAHAALSVGCWHVSHGNFRAAFDNALLARLAYPPAEGWRLQAMLEARCRLALGDRENARRILNKALVNAPDNASLQLCMANAYEPLNGRSNDAADQRRLEWINRPFLSHNLAPIEKRDPSAPLKIDNLSAPGAQAQTPREDQPKVSVIIPAYAAAETLHIALDSLLAQTWENLEILVVDDRSPDATFEVAREYQSRDPRVIAMQVDENGGAYPARNAALRRATGTFVTVHDSDDWSHPQKIELQVRHLLHHADCRANLTVWMRCYRQLHFRSPTRFSKNWLLTNYSSLMLRRELLLQLGGWDEVRVGADSELVRRLEHGQEGKLRRVQPGVPLSFALDEPSSLTRQSATHVHTIYHGVRRTYHEAATFWLETQAPDPPALPGPGQPRAFPAPGLILPKRSTPKLDLLFILDFNLAGGAYVSTLNYVLAAERAGFKVGIFHWRRYDLNGRHRLQDGMMQLAQEGKFTVISPGETVEAETVVVGYPVILKYRIDLPPEIHFNTFAVVTNQMFSRLYSGGDVQYDPGAISRNVEEMFGKRPTWIPISDLVRGLMVKDGRYAPIHAKTWNPLIDAASWLETEVKWRKNERPRPVIGRHARDHYTKWPTTAEAIRAAYCADQPCEVTLLGGAKHAIEILGGEPPANWVVHPYGTMEALPFLQNLDFFLHYPHEDYIEEFGRAVIEAMAAGVPVILPEVFRPTFGDAALYAEPSGVWPLIDTLWADEGAWLERVRVGRQFVRDNCDWKQFPDRLAALVAESGGAPQP